MYFHHYYKKKFKGRSKEYNDKLDKIAKDFFN